MKLHILSDLHLEFGHIELPKVQADVTILAGDIHKGTKGVSWAIEAFADRPVIYVAGNHEFYGGSYPRLIDKMKAVTTGTSVHVLENEEIQINGVRFLGCTLWTDYALLGDVQVGREMAAASMNDFRRIRHSPTYRRFSPTDAMRIHLRSRSWLEEQMIDQQVPIVVVTHHAPSHYSLDETERGPLDVAYASNLEDLLHRCRPNIWIHGHIHKVKDYSIESTQIVSNPRGYGRDEVLGFRPDFVLEV